MRAFIAVDAGGTRTRAACAKSDGAVLGYAVTGSGNPIGVGDADADRAVVDAITEAIASARVAPDAVTGVLCRAGDLPPARAARLAARCGLAPGALTLAGDSMAAYAAVADEPEGVAVVIGTGAVVSILRGGSPVESVDGLGWLLGDAGGGFALGLSAVRAVAEDLDGRGPATSLTAKVLATMERPRTHRWGGQRSAQVAALLDVVYAGPPAALATYAPLVFAEESGDAVARRIVAEQEAAAAATIRTALARGAGPVAAGGSVLLDGYLRPGRPGGDLVRALDGRDVRRSPHAVVGAVVLSLRQAGLPTGPGVRLRCAQSLAELSGSST